MRKALGNVPGAFWQISVINRNTKICSRYSC